MTAGSAGGMTAGAVGGMTGGVATGSTAGTVTGSTAGTVTGSTAGTVTGSTAGTMTGSTAGTMTGSTAGTMTGSTAGTMTGSTAGTGGTGGGVALSKCDTASTAIADRIKPCGSFVGPKGVELQLGPYGAVMEPNVGKGFENEVDSGDNDNNFSCSLFVSIFGAPQAETDKLLTTGDLKFDIYTVYRPANWPATKVPIITWGNGTCAQPEGYGALLRYIASHGFIVVAANSRWVGSGAAQKKGLDFMFKANEDPTSPYYQKLDTTKVAAAGHSQGGQGTVAAASDSRISNVILFNSAGGNTAVKPFLAVAGDRDLFTSTASDLRTPVNAATKAAFLWYHMVPGSGGSDGHLTLMQQPERVAPATVAWFKYLFTGDAASKEYFLGSPCKLCGHDADYEFGQKGL